MQKLILMSAAAFFGFAAVAAQAMPFSPVAETGPAATLVAQGCGPGWARGPYGHCHPMGYARPAPYYHPYAYARPPYPHRCWWANGVRVCR